MKMASDLRSGLTQDIKMGSCECLFQCDVPHQWIAQRQVGPVSVYCDGWGFMSCVCGMVFLCGSTLVKVPLLQTAAGTDVIGPQMFKSDVKTKHPIKQIQRLTANRLLYHTSTGVS